jgi:hypothetical protein
MTATNEAVEAKRYRVTAPLATCKTRALAGVIPGRSGYTVVSLYRGSLIPADAPAADVERLLGQGFIEAVES